MKRFPPLYWWLGLFVPGAAFTIAVTTGAAWASRLAPFTIIAEAVVLTMIGAMGFLGFSVMDEKEKAESKAKAVAQYVLFWRVADRALDATFICALAAFGWYWCASMRLLQALAVNGTAVYIRSYEPKHDEREQAMHDLLAATEQAMRTLSECNAVLPPRPPDASLN